jgi:hypothetical protein
MITGKNILSKPLVNEIPPPNLSKNTDQNVRNCPTIGNDPNMRKIPSGVQAPQKDSIPIPTKTVEPDAVLSKIYDAILTNKKKKEKAGTIGGTASGQAPT